LSEIEFDVDDDADLECRRCGWHGKAHALRPIRDLVDRIDPGEVVPAGECPACGALAHLVTQAPCLAVVGPADESGRERRFVFPIGGYPGVPVKAQAQAGPEVEVRASIHVSLREYRRLARLHGIPLKAEDAVAGEPMIPEGRSGWPGSVLDTFAREVQAIVGSRFEVHVIGPAGLACNCWLSLRQPGSEEDFSSMWVRPARGLKHLLEVDTSQKAHEFPPGSIGDMNLMQYAEKPGKLQARDVAKRLLYDRGLRTTE
jgi:hypothetical protein